MKKAAFIAATLLWSASAAAEQVHGVEVYPGAKADAAVAKQVEKMGIKNAATYRTGDPVAKVAEFYRKQKLEEMPGTSKQGASFTAKGAMITIQNPWLNMDNSTMMNDTLISIVRKK